MPRCPDCTKFVSLDTEQDPEDNLAIDDEGNITGDIRIVNNCAECGTELTEASFDIEIELSEELAGHTKGVEEDGADTTAHDLEIDVTVSRDERSEGSGRGRRQFYGFRLEYEVRCRCRGGKGRVSRSTRASTSTTSRPPAWKAWSNRAGARGKEHG